MKKSELDFEWREAQRWQDVVNARRIERGKPYRDPFYMSKAQLEKLRIAAEEKQLRVDIIRLQCEIRQLQLEQEELEELQRGTGRVKTILNGRC